MTAHRILSFRLNNQLFGVDVNAVLNVQKTPDLTKVPCAPRNLLGVTEVDNALLCVFDPRPGLDIDQKPDEPPEMSVIVSTQEGPIAFVIAEVGQVLELNVEKLERPPTTMSKKARTLIRHICQQDDELLFILNPNQIALAS